MFKPVGKECDDPWCPSAFCSAFYRSVSCSPPYTLVRNEGSVTCVLHMRKLRVQLTCQLIQAVCGPAQTHLPAGQLELELQ